MPVAVEDPRRQDVRRNTPHPVGRRPTLDTYRLVTRRPADAVSRLRPARVPLGRLTPAPCGVVSPATPDALRGGLAAPPFYVVASDRL